jgi:hypothetical protein
MTFLGCVTKENIPKLGALAIVINAHKNVQFRISDDTVTSLELHQTSFDPSKKRNTTLWFTIEPIERLHAKQLVCDFDGRGWIHP